MLNFSHSQPTLSLVKLSTICTIFTFSSLSLPSSLFLSSVPCTGSLSPSASPYIFRRWFSFDALQSMFRFLFFFAFFPLIYYFSMHSSPSLIIFYFLINFPPILFMSLFAVLLPFIIRFLPPVLSFPRLSVVDIPSVVFFLSSLIYLFLFCHSPFFLSFFHFFLHSYLCFSHCLHPSSSHIPL